MTTMENEGAWSKVEKRGGGYGPVRRKDEASKEGIVFEPLEVEENAADEVEEGDDDEMEEQEDGGAPYKKPDFPALNAQELNKGKRSMRRIPVPSNRLTPLKTHWMEILQPLVEHMKLQVRMNTKRRCVEIRASNQTDDIGSLQKGADFVKAYMLGFDVNDAIAMLRLDDLFIESFQVKDVKRLKGDHLSRCIGRLAGKDGKTKHAIENATRTRICLVEDKIHILGSFGNIKLSRDAVCSLILGAEPGKVYNRLRTVTKRLQERL